MAYNRSFNPDALPAHAEPEQAAQALSALPANRKSSPSTRPSQNSSLNPISKRLDSPPRRRYSPVTSQQAYNQSSHHNASYGQATYQNEAGSGSPGYNTHHNPSSNSNQTGFHYPPPQGYGHGPPPLDPTSHRPFQSFQPPRTPAPPPAADSSDLLPLFHAANASRSGVLSESELGSALVNADYTSFDPYTIQTMMRMFSSAPSRNFITYDEFLNLWRFLAAWRELFERFDEDHSGRISLKEFNNALVTFGYRLSMPFVGTLYHTYIEKGLVANARRGSKPTSEGMTFDLFVQACISLKKMTDVFKGYDDDRDGYITLSFEEFLTEILKIQEGV